MSENLKAPGHVESDREKAIVAAQTIIANPAIFGIAPVIVARYLLRTLGISEKA